MTLLHSMGCRLSGRQRLLAALAGSLLIGAGPATAREDYEVWASDQSNSRAGVTSPGTNGSWLWIWDGRDVEKQLRSGQPARPLSCDGRNLPGQGPCDLWEVFPGSLKEFEADGTPTGRTLAEAPGFGRLHGMLPDPQNRYMNANIFAPKGGYVGIIDGRTKEAVALFRVPETSSGRSVHMSFWNSDGTSLLVANLHGKVLHRIDVRRNFKGDIVDVVFNRAASLGLGKDLKITAEPVLYRGRNGQGRELRGRIAGSPDSGAMGDLTPRGECKENGCTTGEDAAAGGRPKNLVICPMISDDDHAYVTLAAGGLLVADTRATPMRIIGEYGQQEVNGAGCGGVQTDRRMWLNAGVSASPAGADQSTFTLYSLDDTAYVVNRGGRRQPTPTVIFSDPSNTATIGHGDGPSSNGSGQLPGRTTRRDAHGMVHTLNSSHVHTTDRIRNLVEVIDVATGSRSTYDLTSADGQGRGIGPCGPASVTDDPSLPGNDPAPDLVEATPDGRYLMVAFRGPIPVSVNHAAQGSCPGVGVVELTEDGASGRLVGVLRTTNTVDTSSGQSPGGHAYTGREHSDIHGAAVRRKK